MTVVEATRRLKRRAEAAGFDRVGVAAATTLERDGAALESWLAGGHHAGMEWIRRTRGPRTDPRELLDGCRSVLILAANYWPGPETARPGAAPARVARYAQGRDYHKLLGREVRRLAGWLDDQFGSTSRAFVDTGPVLERAWAERAGLGWIGKNTCLIDRGLGSWLLLAEVLTTAELEPDSGPHADFCGSCRACIDACPTGAIVADGVVDSRLCISYWSIEHRGTIPASRRAGQGDWIFGCDICQEVCPWNRSFAVAVPPERFERRADLAGLDAEEILELDEAEFRRRYSGTPLMRAKWEGMRRNACIVLGNSGKRRAIPALRRALGDSDPVVREHAAWALERIDPGAGSAGGRSTGPGLE